ncbi:MAG: ferredoxin [Sulfurimonas sp.]|jgi:ferredoxin
MISKEVDLALSKIGSLSITTLNGSEMHSRIISIVGTDDDGIYFLTMNVKPFYRQLKANPHISLCGIYPSGKKEGINKDGQPYWPPGFFLRISGEVREISDVEVEEKAGTSKIHEYAMEDAKRYPAMKLFCLYKGKGEIFDYDFELENRDHKLLRKRFAFGGMNVNEAGTHIDPDLCISCGACYDVCTFGAIVEGDEAYEVLGERCDECGSCVEVCPSDAISYSNLM